MTAPLKNIRVLDMSRVLAGPWAGQLLGDYGADVVKVERPDVGDDTRQWGPPWLGEGGGDGEAGYFLATNRNKRSITINIADSIGQDLVRSLAAHADVLIENYRAGTMERYGLGAKSLLEANPKLIYCSITAFGLTGSRSGEPGYDAMIQASAGLMSVTGPPPEAPGGPQKVGVAISDIMAGMYASTAILAALNSRVESGVGQHIDVPLYDSQVAWLANQNMNFLLSGESPTRMGTAHPNLVPYQAFRSSDGDFMLAVGNDKQFAAACRAVGLPELAADVRFSCMSARLENRGELIRLLQDRFAQKTTATWLADLRGAGVPVGPINDIAEVLSNEYANERQLVRHIKNSNGDSAPLVSNPVDFSATPVSYQKAPPLLGEHTNEVLREWLGYSDAQIKSLRQDDAI